MMEDEAKAKLILWDTDNDEQASNWDGTNPTIIDGFVYVKELGCNCNPVYGAGCGGCTDIVVSHEIGARYIWKPSKEATNMPNKKGTI